MKIEQLHKLKNNGFEIALHRYSYKGYENLPLPDIQTDIEKSISFFNKIQLPFIEALAFRHNDRITKSPEARAIYQLLNRI